jgi:hypothetical protein
MDTQRHPRTRISDGYAARLDGTSHLAKVDVEGSSPFSRSPEVRSIS